MARTAIANNHSLAADTGLNLTDAAVETMSTGAGNGVEVPYAGNKKVLLRNDSGGAATYTFKVPTPSNYSAIGATVPDIDVEVANGKDVLMPLAAVMQQSDDKVYIDCDVAGKIAAIEV